MEAGPTTVPFPEPSERPRRLFSSPTAPLNTRNIALTVVSLVVGIAALRLAAGLIVPIVISLLAAYALDPVVRGLRRLHIPRWLGSAVVVCGLVVTLGSVTYSVSDNVASAINRLPEATTRLQQELRTLRGQSRGPIRALERAADGIEAIASEAAGVRARPAAPAPALQLRESLLDGTMTLLGFSGTLVMLVLFVYFLLAAGDRFKRKLVRLAGPTLAGRRTAAETIDDINRNVERFLVVVVLMNLLVATMTWLAFRWIGLANAGAWGLVGGILNAIPYFGSAIAVGIFFLAGLLQFNQIDMALLTGGVFLLITSFESMWVTPWLLGRTARMNNVAVFGGLLFWGWLWGPWGLLLAFPITMVIKTVSDRVEALRPLGELLGE